MCEKDESDRILAIERYYSGEKPKAIYTSLGHSKNWFFKWLKRYDADNPQWFRDDSRRPLTSPYRTPDEIEKIICMTRRHLYGQNTFCGPQAILWQMEEDGIAPLPSESTIKRILKKHELINKRTGRYEPKGKKYPSLSAINPNDVQQFDFVGPCYLEGAFRFYSLHGLDVASRRCAIAAMPTRKDVYLSVWDAWRRLGIPRFAQFDNALEFCGSRKHPRGMGQVIRLCLRYGVQAVFIPICEPWRNGHVEKFNDHWNKMFYSRVRMQTKKELEGESLEFETRHNLSWRYSPLDGKTPLGFLKEHGTKLKFPSGIRPEKLSKPAKGKYHVMRFVRSDLNLDIFGEKFQLPQELQYEYVQATINVASERLQVYHNKIQVAEFSYKMR
ncbi:MAG: transposase [Deltaproteobacteria bacterium]|nr:transposase [Deltaproteobacteria bacterium]